MPGLAVFIRQYTDPLTENIIDRDLYIRRLRKIERYRRDRIKRIRIVLVKGKLLRDYLPKVHYFPEVISAVTGWDVSLGELLETGERIGTLRHAFNLREGLNPLRFGVPSRVIGVPPHEQGPLKGVTVDVDTLVKDYVQAMGWHPVTAKPNTRRLLELGLDDVVEAIR